MSCRVFLFSVLSVLTVQVWAAQASLMTAEISRDEPGERPGLFVAAHYEFDLPQPLLDAMHRGIPLYFQYEFTLSESRWYWFDKVVADTRFNIRLSFNPLTRRYAVSYNGLSLNFDSLDQALPFIKSIRRWRVAPNSVLTGNDGFTAEIRFSLDTSQLPKPMQVSNNDTADWTIESAWSQIPIPSDIAEE